jgi:hypothetical protein
MVERFTRRYLYTPTEVLPGPPESGDREVHQQSIRQRADRVGKQEHKSRSGKAAKPTTIAAGEGENPPVGTVASINAESYCGGGGRNQARQGCLKSSVRR